MVNRPCRWPGCPAIVARGVGYCPRHTAKGQQHEADRVRQYDAGRDPRAVAFYRSAAWLAMRRQVLSEQPVCSVCRTRFAHHVDHVVPLSADWSRRLDRSNLDGKCQPCHTAKTAAERAAERRLRVVSTHDAPRAPNAPQIATGAPADGRCDNVTQVPIS